MARWSLILDLLALVVAALAATLLSSHDFSRGSLTFVLAAIGTWLFTAMTLRQYDPWASDRAVLDDVAMQSILVLAVTTVLALMTFVFPEGELPHVGLFLLVAGPLSLTLRAYVFRSLSPRSGPVDEVLIVGTGALARATLHDLRQRGRHEVFGMVRLSGEPAIKHARARVLGPASDLESVLRSVPVAEVYFASTHVEHTDEIQAGIKLCERFGVPFATPAIAYRLDRSSPLVTHAIHDGYVHYQSVRALPVEFAMKRLFDIVSAGVALWILGPLLLLVAALVKLTSDGPVLFRQKRVGLHGRPFEMLKFRTMVVNAEALKAKLAAQNEMDGPVFKMKHDPRITPLGRVLRKFSIDELPQLINVLRGDMTVVGPRPALPTEVAKYEAWQRRRLSVRPGLTCIWQVSGRNEISFEQWMYMDLQYIDTWSFSKDLALIMRTFPVVLTGRGAS
ncbi:MAG: sugar transferase [Archangium sp.]